MFHLNISHYGHNFTCPHCGAPIDVEWTTEYGDPLEGAHEGKCPECGKEVKFEVEITITYTAKL